MNTESHFKKTVRSSNIGSSEYRLYDSIKHVGLLEPLVFAKNSDTQEIELFGGGHTRVKLLNAIQQERKLNRLKPVPFQIVVRDCLVTSREIGLSHLIQNYVLRHRKFIDKALHLHDCIETKEKEIKRKMSQREIVRWLRESGFPISQSLVNDMQFTANRLYPLLPQALNNGMGRRHIVSVRKLYRSMREIWKTFGENLNDCREAFEDTCEECDDEIFDMDLFCEVMAREICLWCDLNSQHVRAMLQVDQKERTRLMEAFANADRKGMPLSSSLPKTSQQTVSNTELGVPTSNCVPVAYDLPPAVINRRKRYARRVALDLAQSAGLLNCVSGSVFNAIGYETLNPSRAIHPAKTAIWQFLYYCHHAVQSNNRNSQRMSGGWRSFSRKDFSNVCSLVEVTRTLCEVRRQRKSAVHLQKAA